jgi:multiple sugar transport system permease protein
MRFPTFLAFISPSLGLLLGLLLVPLVMTFYLSTQHCSLDMEEVVVKEQTPFGVQETKTMKAKLGGDGKALTVCAPASLSHYTKLLDTERLGKAIGSGNWRDIQSMEFWGAMEFTLFYVIATTPFVLGLGLLLALCVNASVERLKSFWIAASLLPFVITPVVGALAIKWLFKDNGLIPYLLSFVNVNIFWMAEAWSARLLIVLYGVWHVVPFAFIVLYAGLQSLPSEAIEAAHIDGANRWQILRYVTIPHLMPLIAFISLIHVMDAYRVFEPVVVLTQGTFTKSVQYLTYHILMNEDNASKASAAAVLTIVGIALLLIPLLRKTWKEYQPA